MPKYLIQQTGDGTPVGVFTDLGDYFDPEYKNLEAEGRQLVFSKPPTVDWDDFIERLAATTPSRTMRWDTYIDPSQNIQVVLAHAQKDLEDTTV